MKVKGIKNNIVHLIKELKRTTKEYETLIHWFIDSNNKVKIRIDLLYVPQETVKKILTVRKYENNLIVLTKKHE